MFYHLKNGKTINEYRELLRKLVNCDIIYNCVKRRKFIYN
jgi:hypothetical protein